MRFLKHVTFSDSQNSSGMSVVDRKLKCDTHILHILAQIDVEQLFDL